MVTYPPAGIRIHYISDDDQKEITIFDLQNALAEYVLRNSIINGSGYCFATCKTTEIRNSLLEIRYYQSNNITFYFSL